MTENSVARGPVADAFPEVFAALTGHPPFPWQRVAYDAFLTGAIPDVIDIPTGLGKTSVIALWLMALAELATRSEADTGRRLYRRLVYVVNRRTVVDQSTREAERIRENLLSNPRLDGVRNALRSLASDTSGSPLAISTLRGEFADNAEWLADPARVAIVIGTVDMIGSRLLFSGYGRGYRTRPFHAALLGQDALLLHDEAHLEPAFQALAESVEREQQRHGDLRPLKVIAMTATSRADSRRLSISDDDRAHEVAARRVQAPKRLALHAVENPDDIAPEVCRRALERAQHDVAVLVFLRRLDDLVHVAEGLRASGAVVRTLTGTMRGEERDALVHEDKVFARFGRSGAPHESGAAFLVCTSAGEVGIDMSADHMICDLVPFDGMAQRLGRVNRYGTGDATVDVVHATAADSSGSNTTPFDDACSRTLALLEKLPLCAGRHDASPAALANLPDLERRSAFSPPPVVPDVTEILFDAWAMTSVRTVLPNRPRVDPWLHGISPDEPPHTTVAWREEVDVLAPPLVEEDLADDLLDEFPLKPNETLRERTDRVAKHVAKLALAHPDAPAWVVDEDRVRILTLGEIAQSAPDLSNAKLILAPSVGGLVGGHLDGAAGYDAATRYDVSTQAGPGATSRARVWDGAPPPEGMRLVRTIDTRPDDDGAADEDAREPARRYWHWYVRPRDADDDGSRSATAPLLLSSHLERATDIAGRIVAALNLPPGPARAIELAAQWHDLGKARPVWQRSIGNVRGGEPLAKGRVRPLDLSSFRHEFASLLDAREQPEFLEEDPDVLDLALHVVAAHHGRGRPHFPACEAFDPQRNVADARRLAEEVPQRYGRLQRKYGRWGLAFLESLLRAADALASREA